jgi:Raf kinase inhibitor-like YbhB/YbcL family protein
MNSKVARTAALSLLLFAAAVLRAQAQQAPPAGPPPGPPPAPFTIASNSFTDVTPIPQKYTCSATFPPPGGPRNISTGISPELHWSNPPKGTVSFVLLMHDPDAHIPKATTDITHWLVFNIPADAAGLPENVPQEAPVPGGGLQANNTMGKAGFQGSCAGPGPYHHYTFELLALDTKLDLPQGATRDQVLDAAKGHVLGSTVTVGLFHR